MVRTIPNVIVLLVLLTMLVAAPPVAASVVDTELFLPAVGTGPGVPPSFWYTTIWVFNPNVIGEGDNFRLHVTGGQGDGRAIVFGSRVANGSQDATTFEMSFPPPP